MDLFYKKDSLFVLTRSFLFVTPDDPDQLNFSRIQLPAPENYDNKEGLFKTLWVIHSGEIGGRAGKLIVDFIGPTFIFLPITGLIYWLFPKWIKRRKQEARSVESLKKINLFSLKWQNKAGIWMVTLLLITTMTGMFLRPPLLIIIASANVEKIPFTLLDTRNPWYDKLRRTIFDKERQRFVIGTNQGIYYCDHRFSSPLKSFPVQPPISVMGINVFEEFGEMGYLVGSLNGLFLWNPDQNILMDFLTQGNAIATRQTGSPLSDNMTAGYINPGNGRLFHFDYNRGMESLIGANTFPAMPEMIIEKKVQCRYGTWHLSFKPCAIIHFCSGDFISCLFRNSALACWLYLSGACGSGSSFSERKRNQGQGLI